MPEQDGNADRREDDLRGEFERQVDNAGSMFLALLIRCWKLALAQGGMMALSGVNDRTRELLRVTSLDTVWPMYESRREAIEALQLD